MSKPTHIADVVTNPKEGSEKEAVWNRVGAIWPHKNDNGFYLVIPDGITLSGWIVIKERREKGSRGGVVRSDPPVRIERGGRFPSQFPSLDRYRQG
jgi:hypothetical protein